MTNYFIFEKTKYTLKDVSFIYANTQTEDGEEKETKMIIKEIIDNTYLMCTEADDEKNEHFVNVEDIVKVNTVIKEEEELPLVKKLAVEEEDNTRTISSRKSSRLDLKSKFEKLRRKKELEKETTVELDVKNLTEKANDMSKEEKEKIAEALQLLVNKGIRAAFGLD